MSQTNIWIKKEILMPQKLSATKKWSDKIFAPKKFTCPKRILVEKHFMSKYILSKENQLGSKEFWVQKSFISKIKLCQKRYLIHKY